ncbi:hypothetical protein [Thermomonospora amylolytica]|uniref:hypothetical protein n=1 Tax=Thermomonospora amylolytica TaxID=1411117 RepID=UPI000E6D3A90|nr:hypothetical protein [Thermomonospora amylolytica]
MCSRTVTSIVTKRLTFTVEGDWHHWLCSIAVTEKGVKLVFHKGARLEGPHRVLSGSGRHLREPPAVTALGRPEATAGLVRDAIVHQADMPR